jgi:peptidoglycan/LPS O-acetylase OafA/YrhL
MNPEYRADIDGLRAVAVVLVVAFHAFPTVMPGGFVGVDVFFVISAYLITGLILSDLRSSSFSLAGFYARRARRILPALAVVLAAVLALGWWLGILPAPYQSLGLHAFAGALFFPNLVSWSEVGYFDVAADHKPLLHLWSLGVEEQFYLVWPVLLLILSRRWRWLIVSLSVIVAGSFFYSLYATEYQPAAAFYSPLSRLWELGAGGILASTNWRLKNRFLSVLGVALIVGSSIALQKTSPFPGALALFPVAGAALVIISGSPLLSHKWPVSIGLISYPLYLWHWPLLSFAAMSDQGSWQARMAIVATSIVLAALTTAFIERPIRFGRLRPFGISVSLAAMTAVAGFAALIWGSSGLLWRYPREILPVLATMNFDQSADNIYRCWLPNTVAFEIRPVDCAVGDTLLWGDSHAGRLAVGLKRDGIALAQFIKENCPPVIGFGHETCMQGNATALQKIAELRPKKIILFAAWLGYRSHGLSDASIAVTLTELKKICEDVVVIGPAPVWAPNLPTQVYNSWNSNRRLPDRLPRDSKSHRDFDRTLAQLSDKAHVRFVSAFDALCNDEGCLTHTSTSRSELLTWDYGHLTAEGARFLAPLLQLN